MKDRMISTLEAAEIMGVHPSRVRQLVAEEKIKAELIGRTTIIMESDLKAYMTTRRSVGRPRGAKNKKGKRKK